MYAKVFAQIFDSSIANNYELRHFFTDLLVLAEIDGVVDMTPEAISARTRIPLDMVTRFLAELSQPDPRSRSPENDGRRIVLLDEHRDWGWQIVNYAVYRQIASEEQRREKTKTRVRKYRIKSKLQPCNAPVTHGNACNAMQRQMQRQMQKHGEGAAVSENGPEWEAVEAWLAQAQKDGADYTRAEARSAFLAFTANGWMFGRNPVADYRSAIERQIQQDRNHNAKPAQRSGNTISISAVDYSRGA